MNPKTDGRILPPADENDKKSNDVLFPMRKQDVFLSRALSESESKMKLEVRANHTCALKECKPKVQHEFSAAGRVEHSGIY